MKDHQDRHPASGINVGDVYGTGIVIGHESSASVELRQPSEQRDVAVLLDEFILLLTRHENSVAHAADIRESAAAARAELAKPSPRWPVVRGLLKGIAAGVGSVSVLAGAVYNILALVAHLPR
jgi:hypothetical protein